MLVEAYLICEDTFPANLWEWKCVMTTTDSFLRLPEVLAIIPVSRATWYEGIKKGRFPAPVKLGPRVSLWRRSEIELLIASLSTSTAATLN